MGEEGASASRKEAARCAALGFLYDPIACERQANGVGGGCLLDTLTIRYLSLRGVHRLRRERPQDFGKREPAIFRMI